MSRLVDVDLARASVFLDFDGTITTVDADVYLLDRLAPPEWRSIDEEFRRGEIGSRVCLLDTWDLLTPNEEAMRAVYREVPIDPDTGALLEALRGAGAEVLVVSDGFGVYAREVCADLGVPVLTNDIDWVNGRLEFPHEDRCCACSSCGVCKQAPIKDAKYAGRTTVLVGDGAAWCARSAIDFVPYSTMRDVLDALVPTQEPVL
jgi:2-hydroxy-3-keto-5-methylthiopentenyl-1-phosphate phosphatase